MSNLATRIAALGASAHWRLGEDNSSLAIDAIGTRHATWNTIPTAVDGLVNHDANGAQQLSASRAKTTQFDLTDNFTVMSVVQIDDVDQTGIICKNGSISDGWALIVSDQYGATGKTITVIVDFVIVSVFSVDRGLIPGLKYLITVARRSGTWELWVNDILQQSVVGSAPVTPTLEFTIGGRSAGTNYFQGTIDEVAVFPTALSAANILELTKLVYLTPPTATAVTVGDNDAGGDTFTISTAATQGSFPVDGYAIWESLSSEEDSFEFDRAPLATIAPAGTFAARTAARGKYYAIRAFDDRDEPNYGQPVIVASVAVPVDAADVTIAKFKADAALGTASGGMVAEVLKIPRAATAVTAAAVRRNKVADTASTLDETLEATP